MNPSVQTNDERFLELLERWLAGNFTRKDERELHALTESDPFRREAWEGFASMPEGDHQQVLEQLRQRLFPRRPQAYFSPGSRWLAVAALFVFVLAALYFIPNWTASEAGPVAQNTPAEQPVATPAAPAPTTSATAPDDEGGRPNLPPQTRDRSNTPAARADDAAPAAEDIATLEMEAPAPVASKPFQDIAVKRDAQSPAQTGPAYPAIGGQETISNAALPVQSPPESTAKTRTERADSIVKKMEDQSKDKSSAAPKKAPEQEATPEGGWDNFRQYLRQNARLTVQARNNNITGTVRVQFQVDKTGKPEQIKVLQSLGYGCDEEAIRLLRAVQWTPAGAGPVLVDVPFVR
ncbi:MAG: TonB family protein [Saprospiraceae bacterium]|nr:TonB family protein [Saprospiraceae bacterium]